MTPSLQRMKMNENSIICFIHGTLNCDHRPTRAFFDITSACTGCIERILVNAVIINNITCRNFILMVLF